MRGMDLSRNRVGLRLLAFAVGTVLFLWLPAPAVRAQETPLPEWVRQFGTAREDRGTAVAVDASGIYLVGCTNGTLPGQTGSGGFDLFIRKYDRAGIALWTRQGPAITGLCGENAPRIAADVSGVYVAGSVIGALPGQSSAGEQDVFIRKYDPDGIELWTRQFGSSRVDEGAALAADASGVVLAGTTTGTLPQQPTGVGEDVFVRKYTADGTPLWTRQFGTSAQDWAFGVAADGSSVYVAGRTTGTLPGQTSAGFADAFVRKYDAGGNEVWTRQVGTASSEGWLGGVAVAGSGVVLAGFTMGAFPGQAYAGGWDPFVIRFDADGNALWTRQFGSPGTDHLEGLAVGASGVYVAGYTTAALPGQTSAGEEDAFVRGLDVDGNELWTLQFGTSVEDIAFGIASDGPGLYVAGYTDGAFPGQASAGDADAFLLSITVVAGNVAPVVETPIVAPEPSEKGQPVTVSAMFSDFGADNGPFACTVDYGDGSGEQPGTVSGFTCAGPVHVYADYGSYTVSVAVADQHGASSAGVAAHLVSNLGPAVETPIVTPEPSEIGQPATASAAFDDLGADDGPFVCTVDYGDGSGAQPGAVSGFTCTGPAHAYTDYGSYPVIVSVTDNGAATGTGLRSHLVAPWLRQFGTPSVEIGMAVAVDASGIYVAGCTGGTYPGQTGSGESDLFVRKYDRAGTEQWTRQGPALAGLCGEEGPAMAADASGVYVAGSVYGVLPDQSSAGGRDAFVRKYDPDGAELWTRQFGTPNSDTSAALATDASGVVVAGYTSGALAEQTSAEGADAFVRKYAADGTALWTHQFGTSDSDAALGIAADDSGIYVSGNTEGALPGQTSAGAVDAFVRKYDAGGSEVWTRQFGTADEDGGFDGFYPTRVAAASWGVYVAGRTMGAFPGQISSGDWQDFLIGYDANGNWLWTRQFGALTTAFGLGVAADPSGVYVAGFTTGALAGQTSAGDADAFVRRFSFDGDELSTLQFGTSGGDYAFAIAADGSGNYVTGYTNGTFPGQISAGDADVFLLMLGPQAELCESVTGLAMSWEPVAPGTDQPVTFSAQASGSVPLFFAWDFGDGSTGSAASPTHSYSAAGTYDLVLTVSNACSTGTISETLLVVPDQVPVVDAGPDAQTVVGEPFVGSGSFADPDSSAWTASVNYGDGSGAPPLELNPNRTFSLSHTYAAQGSYTVYVQVCSQQTVCGSDTLLVLVHPAPSPLTEWLRQTGSRSYDAAKAVAVDLSGVYVAGCTGSLLDVRKYDRLGTELWWRQGPNMFNCNVGPALAVDASGVYVAASVSPDPPDPQGELDALLRKYDPDGAELWTRVFGTSASEDPCGLAVDGSGVYVTGFTQGAFPGETASGNGDVFVRKYTAGGAAVWTDQFGTSGMDHAWEVAADGLGVYVAGLTCGELGGETSAGECDAFLRKYTAGGAAVWTHQFGTSGDDIARGVAAAGSGVYVTGYTLGALPGQTSAGSADGFVRKYSADGSERWTVQFGTPEADWASSVAADGSGIHVTGGTTGDMLVVSEEDADALVLKYDTGGSEIWTRPLETSGDDYAYGVAVDATGVHVAGATSGAFPGEPNFGNTDWFVARFDLGDDGVTEEVDPGGTATTDSEGDGATPEDPVETGVTSPVSGTVSIVERVAAEPPPEGYAIVGMVVAVTAPAASAENPLVLLFQLDASLVLAGQNKNSVEVFKDGVAIAACSGDPGVAVPDPCVCARALLPDGDIQITVLTSSASEWMLGFHMVGPVSVASDFSASPASGSLPLVVAFANQSSGDYNTCSWIFGDGGTSSDCNNPTYTYAAAGTYSVALTVSGPGGTDTYTRSDYITVVPMYTDRTLTVAVKASTDDAHEVKSSGLMNLAATMLNMTYNNKRIVGLRFQGVPVPQGATVSSAHVVFTAKAADSAVASLTVEGQAADNAPVFAAAARNLSGRARTAASVAWNGVPAWVLNKTYQTPDLAPIIQEIVDQPGWHWGNSLVLIVSGTGQRRAFAYNGSAAKAPKLEVTVSVPCYTLTTAVDPAGSGAVAASPAPNCGGSYYAAGTVLQLTAQPAAGHVLDSWSGDVAGSTTPLSVTIDGNKTVAANMVPGTEVRVVGSSNDAHEVKSSGLMNLGAVALTMTYNNKRIVGLRFQGVGVPQGATITGAWLELTGYGADGTATSLAIQGQTADNAPTFTTAARNISNRVRTAASVGWNNIPAWTANGTYRSPDLSAVVQEIVDRPGWAPNNALVLIVSGTGQRRAYSYNASAAKAPLLHVAYQAGTGMAGVPLWSVYLPTVELSGSPIPAEEEEPEAEEEMPTSRSGPYSPPAWS